jgi:hypothetical protein
MPQIFRVSVTNNNTGVVWGPLSFADVRIATPGRPLRVDCGPTANSPLPAGFLNQGHAYTITGSTAPQGNPFQTGHLQHDPAQSDPPDIYAFQEMGG